MHFCLRVGEKLFSDLVFWASQILGSLARSVVSSRLLGLFDGFSTSRLDSAQFLFCQQSRNGANYGHVKGKTCFCSKPVDGMEYQISKSFEEH